MVIRLEIQDGNPWYLSPALRLIDIADPALEIMPVAGVPCYLEARVRNTGESRVDNASVRFYWANPAVGFDRSTANPIGNAFVSLDPGQEEGVLCLIPWAPSAINYGHSCVLAEAFHNPLDPLPPTPAFDVPTDRHVAQRNLSVAVAKQMTFHFAFEIHNRQGVEQNFRIVAKQLPLGGVIDLLKPFQDDIPTAEVAVAAMGFTEDRCPKDDEIDQLPIEFKQNIPARGRAGLTIAGRLEAEGAAFIAIEQTTDGGDVPMGGIGLVVVGRP